MSTQFNTIMSNAITAISAEMDTVQAELDRLTEAKNTLESLVTEAQQETTTKKSRRSPDEPPAANATDTDDKPVKSSKAPSKRAVKALTEGASTQRDRIIAMLEAGMKATDIAEALDTHVSYVYTVKRSWVDSKPVTKRAKKASNGNGNGHSNGSDDGESQADKIRSLVKQGVSVKDIADRLNTHPSYVYTVKNRA